MELKYQVLFLNVTNQYKIYMVVKKLKKKKSFIQISMAMIHTKNLH